jgi:uncharacterized protein YndB with AHSA1/START domain
MCTWQSNATVPGSPADVLDLLTEPDAIARWAPVPFEVLSLDGARLEPSGHARVAGRLASRTTLTGAATTPKVDLRGPRRTGSS